MTARSRGRLRSEVRASSDLRGNYVYTQLRAEIENRTLRPGDRIREVEMAERLGVSRTPVREALKRLQAEGLIAFAPSRGFIVAELTPHQVLDIMGVREVLEGAAARFAAEHASTFEIETLKRIHGREPPHSPEDAMSRDRKFHEALGVASHNDYLLRAMNVLRDALALLGPANYSVPGRLESFWREHGVIMHAVARRDPEAAEKAARQHIREAIKIRIAIMFDEAEGNDQPAHLRKKPEVS